MSVDKALYFCIGLGVGAIAGGGGVYIYVKDKFEKQLDEEIKALKAHYIEKDRELVQKNEEKKKELEEKIFSENADKNEFINYTELYNKNTSNEEEAVTSYNEVVSNMDDVSAATEIISNVDFDDPDYDHYRKITVDYFEGGAVFESLSGEELDGFDLIAGDEWRGRFGEFTPNVVYVRNHDIKTDYEIIDHEEPYPHPEDE